MPNVKQHEGRDVSSLFINTKWKAGDPYPTWPFTRVRPEELAKHMQRQQPDDEALL